MISIAQLSTVKEANTPAVYSNCKNNSWLNLLKVDCPYAQPHSGRRRRLGCSARGRHGDFRGAVVKESSSERGRGVGGDFRGAVVKEIRQSGAGEWVGTLGARADINVLSPNKVRQA